MRAKFANNRDKRRPLAISYETVFHNRGTTYDMAMHRYPDARFSEFEQAVNATTISPGMVVADVPAGGGYMRRHLPKACTWLGHEPCLSFTLSKVDSPSATPTTLLPLPWHAEQIDVAISIAGVHHMVDKRPFFTDLFRVSKHGGHLVLSDVEYGSPQAHFLDHFVGLHNSTGHAGKYLDRRTRSTLEESGWKVISDDVCNYHWKFNSIGAMATFCRLLFDLRDVDDRNVVATIHQMLGIEAFSDGRVGMHWALRTIVSQKPCLPHRTASQPELRSPISRCASTPTPVGSP